jgi:O-antigen/teichoic acid export membrane protein
VISFAPISGLAIASDRASLLLLVAAALLNLYSGLYDAVFRCANRYAQGVLVMQSVRLAELIVIAVALSLGAKYLAVAAAIAAVQVLHLTSVYWYLRRLRPNLEWRFQTWDPPTFLPMLAPGLAWMGFRLGDGLAIQGAILVVGTVFGSAAAVTFYAMRTLSRLLFQLVASLGNALWPEVTRLHAAGEQKVVKRMVFRFGLLSTGLMLTGGALLLLLAPVIMNIWTHGKIKVDWPMLGLLLAQVVMLGAWYIPRIYLAAINRVGWLSSWAILLYAGALVLGMSGASRWGILGFVGALVGAETILTILAWRITLQRMRP